MFVPALPDVLEELMDAPIPFIMGVCRSAKDELPEKSDSTLLVMLDEGTIEYPTERSAEQFLTLQELKEKMKGVYDRVFKNEPKNTKRKKLRYCISEEQSEAIAEICQCIEEMLKTNVISVIPKNVKVNRESFDIELVKTEVKKASKNNQFVEAFIETQMFASYVEEQYGIS